MSKAKKTASNIVWFEIPADDTGRAKKFYASLFGWKIAPFPGMKSPDGQNYLHIDTGGPDASPDGGIMGRMHAEQSITSYISVASVTRSMAKVKSLGGSICKEKTAIPGMGYFAICTDTEDNAFAIWEMSPKAK